MDLWAVVGLTAANRPILIDEEVEYKVVDRVSVVTVGKNGGSSEEIFPMGTLILTNIRMIVVMRKDSSFEGRFMELKGISRGEDCAGLLKRSTRVRLVVSSSAPILNNKDLCLKFHDSGKEDLLEALERALAKRSWEKISPAVTAAVSEAPRFSTHNAGVGGIIRRQEKAMENVDTLTKSALSDLDALMKSAREVITVVQRYAVYVASERESQDSDVSETTSQAAESNEMDNILQNIGIVSPITKKTAGRLYHEQLARQIADLLMQDDRLNRLGGLITLTDLYCIFNRARGTALVSPDDLYAAVLRMDKISLGMHLRRFASGVLALQLDSFSDEKSAERLAQSVQRYCEDQSEGMTALEAARSTGGSLVLVKELLAIAEQRGLLCRDDGPHGLFFYPNRFTYYCTL